MSSALPKTFKAAVLDKLGGTPALRDVDLRMPGLNEVLVKVLAAGLCSTDATVAEHGFPGIELPHPRVVGHELVGDVVAVGSAVSSLRVGDRVGAGWHGGHDGTCRACSKGVVQMCHAGAVHGVTRDGALGRFCVVRAEAVAVLPADTDPVQAVPMMCSGVTVFNAMRRQCADVLPGLAGGLVAVQGLGALGHLAVQFYTKMGYRVVVVSSGSAKRSLALALGAAAYIDASAQDPAAVLQSMGGAVAAVSTAPGADLNALLNGLQELGTLLLLAPEGTASFDVATMVVRGLRVAGYVVGNAMDMSDTVAFAEHNGVKAMTEVYRLDDVEAAWARMRSGQARFKVVVDMQEP